MKSFQRRPRVLDHPIIKLTKESSKAQTFPPNWHKTGHALESVCARAGFEQSLTHAKLTLHH